MNKGKEIAFNANSNNYNGGAANSKKSPILIDRSNVRILLWDRETKSGEEISALLCSCSYKVTSVRSAVEVIEFLKAEGPHIDILLAEVRLPMEKNMKALMHIIGDRELRHIAVILLSTPAEISTVIKCLRVGAADYLLKPLRPNELLHLWTHVWRKRRMLGLPQKSIAQYDLNMMKSNHGESNINCDMVLSEVKDKESSTSSITDMSNMSIM